MQSDFDPLLALAFGVFVGLIVQSVAARLRYNGEWRKMDFGRKVAMSLTGAIAAFVIGLFRLGNPDPNPNPDTSYVYDLWLWQTIAAWSGAMILDALGKLANVWVESQERRYGRD